MELSTLNIDYSMFRYNFHGVLNIAVGIFNFTVGCTVLYVNHKSIRNIAFFTITLVSFVWMIGLGMLTIIQDPKIAMKGLSFSQIGVPFISPSVYMLSSVWFNKENNFKKILIGFILAGIFMVPIAFYSSSIYMPVDHSWGRYVQLVDTPFAKIYYLFFMGFFLAYAFMAFPNFYRGAKYSISPIQRDQFRNVFIGYIIGYTGATDFLVTLNMNIYPFGYISLTILISIIAYTLIRHRLFDFDIIKSKFPIIIIIYSFLLLFMVPTTAYLYIQALKEGYSFPFMNMILLCLIYGCILSMGPFVYAHLVRQSFWIKSNFSKGLTHELKSPIGNIQGSIEVLQSRMDRLEDIEHARIIQKNIERLEAFANELLDIAKIQDGRASIKKEKVEIQELVQKILDHYSPLIIRKNLKINCFIEKIEDVWIDRDKISQVISNMVSNAVKFTEKEEIDINGYIEGVNLIFSVKDRGIGIKRGDHKKVFERFYQGEGVSSGSGIGLSIAKGWVEAHGGKIWAESVGKGKGTTVTFILPIH